MMYVLIVLAILLALVGIVGAVVPGIAGTPFSFLALLVLSFVKGSSFSPNFLIIMGVVGAIVFTVDYVVPVWGTKHFGGTKAGVRGSTIGLFMGLLVTLAMPIGFIAILLGPFIGAYIAEKNAGTDDHKAWRSAFGSFIGFLCGTGIKVIYAVACIYFIVKELIVIL